MIPAGWVRSRFHLRKEHCAGTNGNVNEAAAPFWGRTPPLACGGAGNWPVPFGHWRAGAAVGLVDGTTHRTVRALRPGATRRARKEGKKGLSGIGRRARADLAINGPVR